MASRHPSSQGPRGYPIMRLLVLVAGLGMATTRVAAAQDTVSLDGPQRPFQDSLVDHLSGDWIMSGTVGRRAVTYRVHAEWVLNHQFLRIAMRDTARTPEYEAHVYLGRDNTSERYVAHWLDVFGGRWSETPGYGTRAGNAIEFVFEYPDGPFRTTFTWDGANGWSVLMRQRAASGGWQMFGQWTLQRG